MRSERPAAAGYPIDRLPRWIEAVLLLAVILEVITPLFAHVAGTDGPSQLYLLDRFAQSLSEGQIVPRWVHSGFGGRGSPAFYFYPPLAFYVGSLVKFALGLTSWNAIFEWTTWLASIAGFASAYYFIRQLGRPRYWSLVGAALFTYAPFRVAELYSRSSLSSHVAFAFVPLVCVGYVWIVEGKRRPGTLLLGVSAGCLLLTSITVGVAVALLAAIVTLANYRVLHRRSTIALLVAAAIAFGLSAYYLLPAIALSKHLQTSQYWREPAFFILDLLHWRAAVVLYHTAIILLSAGFGVAAWFVIRRSDAPPIERHAARVAFILALVIVFLQLPEISLPVWHLLPPLRLLQASWRMYILIVLSAAVVVAVVRTTRFRTVSNAFVALLALGALVPSAVVLLNIHLFTHADPKPGDPLEYLPKRALAEASVQSPIAPDSILASEPAVAPTAIVLDSISPTDRSYHVSLPSATTVSLPLLYWPLLTFHAGEHSVTATSDSNGYVKLLLPPGDYTLSMSLERSPIEIVGGWISVLTLGAVTIGALGRRSAKGRRSEVHPQKQGGRTKAEMVLSDES